MKIIKKFNMLVRLAVFIFVLLKLLNKFVSFNFLKHGLKCGFRHKLELAGIKDSEFDFAKNHKIEPNQFE